MIQKILSILLGFAGFIILNSGHAASFDCNKARTSMELAICANPALSSLDDTLAETYKSARSALSTAAQSTLVSSQRSWIRFIGTYCFVDTQAAVVTNQQATECLATAYQSRIKDLKDTGKLIGGFKTFTAIDNHIRINKAQETTYVIERKYTQIDDSNQIGRKLNAYLAFSDKPELPDDRGTESYDTQLSQVSPDWLYKQRHIEMFTGAYPTSNTECGIYSISKDRPLKIGDLFQSKEWSNIMQRDARQHFDELAKVEKEFDSSMVSGFESIQQPASNPFSYCFTAKGIELYGFLPHVVRAFDGVTISWRSLDKVLTPYAYGEIKKMGGL